MKPKLIDYKSLNNELKIKILNNKLTKAMEIENSVAKKPQINTNPTPVIIKKSNKTSIIFNLLLGLIILCIPLFLYYRYKTKPSEIEKQKKIIDVFQDINNRIIINPDYKELNNKELNNKELNNKDLKNIELNNKDLNIKNNNNQNKIII